MPSCNASKLAGQFLRNFVATKLPHMAGVSYKKNYVTIKI
jgi:hypothetical protein